MMTVKHIAPSGEQHVWPATHTSYEPGGGKNTSAKELFFLWDENGNPRQVADGAIFVMNEHGRTVARYQIPSDVPQGAQTFTQAGSA